MSYIDVRISAGMYCGLSLFLLYAGMTWVSAFKFFRANKLLEEDDPKKRPFSFWQVILAPALFPVIAVERVFYLFVKSLVALIFFPLFLLLLLFARTMPESFIGKFLTRLGKYILRGSLWMFPSSAKPKSK